MTVPPLDAPRPPRRAEFAAAGVAGVVVVLGVAGAILLFRAAVVPSDFPAYIAGDKRTVIYRYSGPWITAAAGSLLIGLLAATFAVMRMLRLRGASRSTGKPAVAAQAWRPEGRPARG